jgi:hypothetical protein
MEFHGKFNELTERFSTGLREGLMEVKKEKKICERGAKYEDNVFKGV